MNEVPRPHRARVAAEAGFVTGQVLQVDGGMVMATRSAESSRELVSALLRPRSVAVLGASDRTGVGQRVVANLRALHYPGELYLLNPNRSVVAGLPAYPSLAELPAVPDLVVAAVNREATVREIAEASRLGCRAAVVLAAGFAEAGERGRELDAELRAATRDMALLGPNCLGFVNLVDDVAAYSGPLMEPPEPGTVALVSQSGALACVFTGAAAERGLRFSHVITAGNQVGLNMADYLRYLAHHPDVTVIACYVEGFTDGRALVAAMREAVEAGKSVVVLKAGRSRAGGAAARTHTGALAGSAEIQFSVWRQNGVLVATDPEEFLALIELCSRIGAVTGSRVGILTISGGERLLIADAAEEFAIPLARFDDATADGLAAALPAYASIANPLDTTGAGVVDGDAEVHRRAAVLVCEDPNVDIVVACQDAKNGWIQADHSSTLFRDCVVAAADAAATAAKPLVVISPTTGDVDAEAREYLRHREVPLLTGLRPGLGALAQVIGGGAGAPADARGPAGDPQQAPATLSGPAHHDIALSGLDSLALLGEHGVPVCPTVLVSAEAEAVIAAEEFGYPVAMKIDGRGIQHRSELGGVRTGLESAAAVRAAWSELADVAATVSPGGRLPEVLLQPMVAGGVELFVGALRDEQFGPVVLFGSGGVLLEFVQDTAAGLAPLDEATALRLITSTRAYRLLRGFRGGPAADIGRLAAAVAAISRVAARPDVVAIDVNPLIALRDRVTAVDAKIVKAGGGGPAPGNAGPQNP
jgi:acyl-CoA synthetase (NDP forming)